MKRVLVVGSGAREHALTWKLAQSSEVEQLFVAPGNAGTAELATNLPLRASDIHGICGFCRAQEISLVVIGPEAPLALGLADALRRQNVLVVGPDAIAARIESSKSFAKDLMVRAGVPTAAYATFDELHLAMAYLDGAAYPLVVKADGLAAGKGVMICSDREAAYRAIEHIMSDCAFGEAGARVVIEEMLFGPEISLIALVDGERAVALPVAQDHKRLGDGDTGPNTGGMGAYAPVPFISDAERDRLVGLTITPIVRALAAAGTPYRGILFAGLILTSDGPKVLEYNCRLGDPETQVILPLLHGDLLPWLEAVAHGRLEHEMPVKSGSAVGVVLAAPGYPDSVQTGSSIAGLDDIPTDVLVFHAGTALNSHGATVTNGGRVVTVVGRGSSVVEAAKRAYMAPVQFQGMQRRSDIGARAGSVAPVATEKQAPCVRRLPRIAVLASGGGTNLQALLEATERDSLCAEISMVISHDPHAGSLDRARKAGIPEVTIPLTDRLDPVERALFEQRILKQLWGCEPDLIVLTGWMLVLSSEFLSGCRCPLLNVHPALLPMAGEDLLDIPVLRGAHAVRDALALGLPYTGVSVHHVTREVDSGPVICRDMVPIMPGDDYTSLYARIKPVEHRLLRAAVQAILQPTSTGGTYARIGH